MSSSSSRYSSPYRRNAANEDHEDEYSYVTTRSSNTHNRHYNPTRSLVNRNHEQSYGDRDLYLQHGGGGSLSLSLSHSHSKEEYLIMQSPYATPPTYHHYGSRASSPVTYHSNGSHYPMNRMGTAPPLVDLTDYGGSQEEEDDDEVAHYSASYSYGYRRHMGHEDNYQKNNGGGTTTPTSNYYLGHPDNYPNGGRRSTSSYHSSGNNNYDMFSTADMDLVDYRNMNKRRMDYASDLDVDVDVDVDVDDGSQDDQDLQQADDRVLRMRRETAFVDLTGYEQPVQIKVKVQVSSDFSSSYIDLTEVPSMLDDNQSQESVSTVDREWDLMQNRLRKASLATSPQSPSGRHGDDKDNDDDDDKDDDVVVEEEKQDHDAKPRKNGQYDKLGMKASETLPAYPLDDDDCPTTPTSMSYFQAGYIELPAVTPIESSPAAHKKPPSPYGSSLCTAIDLVETTVDDDDEEDDNDDEVEEEDPAVSNSSSSKRHPTNQVSPRTSSRQSSKNELSQPEFTQKVTKQLKSEVAKKHSASTFLGANNIDNNNKAVKKSLEIPHIGVSMQSSDIASPISARSSRTESSADPPGVLEKQPSILGQLRRDNNMTALKDPPGHQQRIQQEVCVRNDAPASSKVVQRLDCPAVLLRQLSNPAPSASSVSGRAADHQDKASPSLSKIFSSKLTPVVETNAIPPQHKEQPLNQAQFHDPQTSKYAGSRLTKPPSVHREIIVLDSHIIEFHASSSSSYSSHGRESRDDPMENVINVTKEYQFDKVRSSSPPPRNDIHAWMASQPNVNTIIRGVLPAMRNEFEENGKAAEESRAYNLLSHLLDDDAPSQSSPSYSFPRMTQKIAPQESPKAMIENHDNVTKTKTRYNAFDAGIEPSMQIHKQSDLNDGLDDDSSHCSGSSSTSVELVKHSTSASDSDIFMPKNASFELDRHDTLSSGQVYCDQKNDTDNDQTGVDHQHGVIGGSDVESQHSVCNEIKDDNTQQKEEVTTELSLPQDHLTLDAPCFSQDTVDLEVKVTPDKFEETIESIQLDSLVTMWERGFSQKVSATNFGDDSGNEEPEQSDKENEFEMETEPKFEHPEYDEVEQEQISRQEIVDDRILFEKRRSHAYEDTHHETDHETDESAVEDGEEDHEEDYEEDHEEDQDEDQDEEPDEEPDEEQYEEQHEEQEEEEQEEDEEQEEEHDDEEEQQEQEEHRGGGEPLMEFPWVEDPETNTASFVESREDEPPLIASPEDMGSPAPRRKMPRDKKVSFKEVIEEVSIFQPILEPSPSETVANAFADVWNTKMAGIADVTNCPSKLGEARKPGSNAGMQEEDLARKPNNTDTSIVAWNSSLAKESDPEEDWTNDILQDFTLQNVVQDIRDVETADDRSNDHDEVDPSELTKSVGTETANDTARSEKDEEISTLESPAPDQTIKEWDGGLENVFDARTDVWSTRMDEFSGPSSAGRAKSKIVEDQDNMVVEQNDKRDYSSVSTSEVPRIETTSKNGDVPEWRFDSGHAVHLVLDKTCSEDDMNSDGEMPQSTAAIISDEVANQIKHEQEKVLSQMSRLGNFLKKTASSAVTITTESTVASFISDFASSALSGLPGEQLGKPVHNDNLASEAMDEDGLLLSFCDKGNGTPKLPIGCTVASEPEDQTLSFCDSGSENSPAVLTMPALENNTVAQDSINSPNGAIDEESTMQDMSLLGIDDQTSACAPADKIQALPYDDDSSRAVHESTEQDSRCDFSIDISVDCVAKDLHPIETGPIQAFHNIGSAHSEENEIATEQDTKDAIGLAYKSDDAFVGSVEHGFKVVSASADALVDNIINISFDNGSKGSSVSALQEPNESPAATLDMECLQTLVTSLMTHEYGFEFSTPVDLSKYPDYDEQHSKYKPLDLGSILRKLINGDYGTILDFQSDVNMTFNFRMKYSKKGSKVYKMAKMLKKQFEKDLLKLLDDLENELIRASCP